MPRRSSRVTAEPAAAAQREAALDTPSPLDTTASHTKAKRRRSSQGTASQKPIRSTAKKSKYFEAPDSDDSESESDSPGQDSGSAYEEAGVNNRTAASDSDSRYFEEEEKPKQRRRGRQSITKKTRNEDTDDENENENESVLKTTKGKELWREGVRTGLGPGKEVFIKKPKARDPGDIPYQDETIHPNTMLFLRDLKENNERQWLKGTKNDQCFTAF
jgi:hypothetical protein